MAVILNFGEKKSSIKCCQCNFEIKATNFLKSSNKFFNEKKCFPISAFKDYCPLQIIYCAQDLIENWRLGDVRKIDTTLKDLYCMAVILNLKK
jgi:hypothetical protein